MIGSLLYLYYNGPQNPILTIKAPMLSGFGCQVRCTGFGLRESCAQSVSSWTVNQHPLCSSWPASVVLSLRYWLLLSLVVARVPFLFFRKWRRLQLQIDCCCCCCYSYSYSHYHYDDDTPNKPASEPVQEQTAPKIVSHYPVFLAIPAYIAVKAY